MKFPFRLLLVAWLCLSLPAQGLAAVATLSCGQAPHGEGIVAPADDASQGKPACANAAIVDAQGSCATHGTDFSGAARCSTCADCCSGAMMSPTNPGTLAAPGGFAGFPLPPLALSSAVAGTLERPPPPPFF